MKVAAGCAQCAVSTPPSAKKHGHLRPHPILERLFNRVTSDFFYLGELDDEECHWTNKKVNGVLLIQCRHSGYIQVLPCNIESMTGKLPPSGARRPGWEAGTSHPRWSRIQAKTTPPNGGENCVLALESTTSDVKSTRIERCLVKEPVAQL